MALSKIGTNSLEDLSVTSGKVANDNIGPTQLNEAANYDFTGTVTGAGGNMTPAFSAQRYSGSVTLNDNTFTDIIFDNEILDTDSAFNTSTGVFTVPTGKGGKYFIGINLMFADGQGNGSDWIGNLVINTSNNYVIRYESTSNATTFTQVTNSWSSILDLSAGDALKVQGYVDTNDSSAAELIHQNFKTSFYGYKIIE